MSMSALLLAGLLWTAEAPPTAPLPLSSAAPAARDVHPVVPGLGPVPVALTFDFPLVQNGNDHRQVFSFWVGFFR